MSTFLYDILVFFINLLMMLFIVFSYQRLCRNKISIKKSIIITILATIIYEPIFTKALDFLYQYLTTTLQNELLITAIYLSFINLSNYFVLVVTVYLVLDKNLKRVTLFSSISWCLYEFVFFILNNFCYAIANTNTYTYLFASLIAVCVSDVLLSYFIRKSDFSFLEHFLDKKETSLFKVILISIGIDLSYVIVRIIINRETFNFNISEFTLLIILLVIIYFFSKNYTALIRTQEENKYLQILLQQQELYVKDLENIHQNMRSFKHDFKNMMTSLYLKSTQGNIEAIEQDLHQLIDDFDENIDKKMNLTNQISKIINTELKSILFQKMTEIDKNDIAFHLEVMYPIDKTPIKTFDLCRIIGILMDNAIEEVKEHIGKITLILSNQSEGLHIIVENTIYNDVDMMKIYQEGYSSKDNHSGQGLTSLKAIINSYNCISHMTEIKEQKFIQDIFIKRGEEND